MMSDDRLRSALAVWRDKLVRPLRDAGRLRRDAFRTDSGLEIPDVHTPLDVPSQDYMRDLGFPGEFPFTRGVYPSMYRGRLWTMRQYAGYASAAASNERYRFLLQQGQTGLSVAFDLPTQIGYDPDHPMAAGEVGKVGVSIASLADMETLLAGIPLDRVSTSMTINATAPVLLAMYLAVAKRQGVAPEEIRGTIQNDILKEYVARGTYIFPPKPSMRLITDTFAYTAAHMPKWNPISISGYHIREAGATAPQEVAFTLANALAYVTAAVERGLEPERFMGRLSFFFAAQNNLLEEVAKFRAARRMWARLASERFGATDPASLMLRFHTQTAGVTLTAQQPLNNVVRVTIQALAAVLGGTQSLHTNSMDEALGLPTEQAVTVALRTQQVLAHESGVADFVDPLAGSYAVESLTDTIEVEALKLIHAIDDMGGALAAVETGWMAAQIAESSYRRQRAVEAGDRLVVGVNVHIDNSAPDTDVLRIDPALEARRVSQMRSLRAGRDEEAVEASLRRLADEAHGSANLMPAIVDAVEVYATVGEICDTMREVFGEHVPAETV